MTARIPMEQIWPVIENGAYAAKATPGEAIAVYATVVREGHDALGASAVLFDPRGKEVERVRMYPVDQDRFRGDLHPSHPGNWSFAIESWDSPLDTWHHDAEIKIAANIDSELMCEEGARLFDEAKEKEAAKILRDRKLSPLDRFSAVQKFVSARYHQPLRRLVTQSQKFPIQVDRERAVYGSWYEFFPRSEGGTFKSAAARLDAAKAMGFDVVYIPPIHPIGITFRKGKNNTLQANPDDVGVPWAIGSKDGGHDAIHPDLGTIKDFDAFVKHAKKLDLEIALDLALQASPDHPWVSSHPEWFTTRSDGSIAYAENPPKKYQDIYPLNFDNDYKGLYAEILRIVKFWIDHGVTIFRVDNPHTKPVHFWEELLADIRKSNPEVIFLAEAFTKPTMIHLLGKIGFHQSYTYFTWRNTKEELESYGREISQSTADYFRPNFFVNTPDILPTFLQSGIPAAFAIRAVLAATMSPTWGVYAGFELYEHEALKPGGEEYLNSEKYQLRPRDWAGAEASGRTLAPLITTLNQIRKDHPALQKLRNLRFHQTDSPSVLAYSKQHGDDTVIVVINIDPLNEAATWVHFNMGELNLPMGTSFTVQDLTSGEEFSWGDKAWVKLNPSVQVAHVMRVVTS